MKNKTDGLSEKVLLIILFFAAIASVVQDLRIRLLESRLDAVASILQAERKNMPPADMPPPVPAIYSAPTHY